MPWEKMCSAITENERTVMGMAEYIEREKIREEYEKLTRSYVRNDPYIADWRFDEMIESLPAADVAPVRHGRWVSVPHKLAMVCSVCNRDEPYKFADIDADVYDYCPNCGAKMDLEDSQCDT